MKVVLFQPQIPQNTGNIVRTCKVTGCDLLLIPPLGFSTSNRRLKRAGLDYWDGVNVEKENNLFAYLKEEKQNFYFFSSKAKRPYTDISYEPSDLLIFGSETDGLPEIYFETWPDKFVTIPMLGSDRCLNLSNCVAIAVYEAIRQFMPIARNN